MRQRAIAEGTSAPLRFAEGIVHGAASPFTGTAQALTHALGSDEVAQAVDQRLAQNERGFNAGTGDTTAGTIGNIVGEVLPYVAGGAGLRAAGLVPEVTGTLGKLGSLAAGGAAIGATTPVTSGDYLSEKAKQIAIDAATGPILYGAGKAASAVGRGARDVARLATEAGRGKLADARVAQALESVSPDVNATLGKLESAQPLVPGETVGAGQAIGGPKAVQLTRQLMNHGEAAPIMAEAKNANDAARAQVLRKLAGTDEELEAAKAARREAVAPYIEQHLQPSTPLTRWTEAAKPLDRLLSGSARMPAADHDALLQARNIVAKVRGGTLQEDDAIEALQQLEEATSSQAARGAFQSAFNAVDQNMVDPRQLLTTIARMRNTGPGARKTVRSALDDITKTIKESENTRGMVPMDVLDSVRQNIGDFLVNATGKRATAQETKLLDPVRHQIVQTLQQRAPGYSDYLAAYAKHSTPINTMERVRALVDANRAGGPNSGGGEVFSPTALKAFLRADDRAKYKIAPEARRQIEAVRDSAQRDALPNVKIGTAGSDTASLLSGSPIKTGLSPTRMRVYGAGLGALADHLLGLPGGAVVGSLGGLGAAQIIEPLLKGANKDVVERMAAKLANAGEAAQAVRNANPAPSKLAQLFESALPYTVPQKTLAPPVTP